MPINKWRFVHDDHERDATYQCLQCRGEFRGNLCNYGIQKWNFCPLCGTRWDGQHVWDTEAKWERVRQGSRVPRATDGPRLRFQQQVVVPGLTSGKDKWENRGYLRLHTGREFEWSKNAHREWRSLVAQRDQDDKEDLDFQAAVDGKGEDSAPPFEPWSYTNLRAVLERQGQEDKVVLVSYSQWHWTLAARAKQP